MIKLAVNGVDISELIKGRLLSCTLSDERNEVVDQLDITLDNTDNVLALPEPDASLQVWFPYKEDFIDMGMFVIDTCELSGPPNTIAIQARSADISDTLKQKREHSFEQTTLSGILNIVAGRNNLIAKIANDIGLITIDHLDQTSESDLSFIARLGELYDAVATVKAGFLLFMKAGQGKAASGENLDTVTIELNQCESYRYQKKRNTYTGVKAFWNDAAYAKRKEVTTGDMTNPFVIRSSFRTAKLAQDACNAKWSALQRNTANIELDLAQGNPLIIPESPLQLGEAFPPEMIDQDLIINRCSHDISSSGYKMSIDAEKKS
jgi:uncharacterized protein